MRRLLALVGSLILLTVTIQPVVGQVDCEAARCAVQAAINTNCTCSTGASVTGNHGNYVSCVAKQVNMLAKADPPVIPTNCKGKVTRCAAHSVCGKAGFVTCTIPVTFGTCDTTGSITGTAGTCATGTLAPTLASCAMDTDCWLTTKCKTKSSSDRCTAAGGAVGASATCCSSCVTPAP